VTASDLKAGDTLSMATGPVTVLRVEATHGGCELLVRPVTGRKGQGTGTAERVLWFWPRQTVSALPGERSTPPGATISRREASRATAAKRKAQGGAH
jgi:hypothetical protein